MPASSAADILGFSVGGKVRRVRLMLTEAPGAGESMALVVSAQPPGAGSPIVVTATLTVDNTSAPGIIDFLLASPVAGGVALPAGSIVYVDRTYVAGAGLMTSTGVVVDLDGDVSPPSC